MSRIHAGDAVSSELNGDKLDSSTKGTSSMSLPAERRRGRPKRARLRFATRCFVASLVLFWVAGLVMIPQALAQNTENTELGTNAQATGQNTTAIGRSAQATGSEGTAVGRSARATNNDTTALGTYSRATGDRATAVGENARATDRGATAVGEEARATGEYSTALGRQANATADRATAVGQWARAYGEDTTAVGTQARSYGDRSTALGRAAFAVGERNTVVGRGALAATRFDDQTHRLLDCLNGPAWVDNAASFADNCDELLTDAEEQDARLRQDDAAGETFRETIRTRLQGRLDDLSTSRATAVGVSSRALNERATAIGNFAYATGDRSTALGDSSRATGDRSTALGSRSRATGDRSTAVGRLTGVSGEDGTGIGSYAQVHGDQTVALGARSGAGAWNIGGHYPDVAAYLAEEEPFQYGRRYTVVADKIYAIAELESIWASQKATLLQTALADASEVMSPTATYMALTEYLNDSSRTDHTQVYIGSDVYKVAELEAIWPSLASTILPIALADASEVIAAGRFYASVEDYLGDDDRTGNTQVYIDGKVYNVADLEAVAALTEDTLPNPLKGAVGAIAVGVGAQAPGEKAIAIGLDAHAVGLNAIAIGAGVTAGADEVVIGSEQHTYKFPGLAASQTVNPEVLTVDGTGQFSLDEGDLYDRVSKLEAGSGGTAAGTSGLGTLAAAGPTLVNEADTISRNTDSDEDPLLGTPSDPADEDGSAFARIAKVKEDVATTSEKAQALERGELEGGGYGEAPAVGSSGNAPADATNRRVVVQDANADGSVRLRTMEIPELSGVGRRLDAFNDRLNALDERLDSATAMSSALSALPNTVPDGGKLFLGIGVGHYGGKQAIALGLSARIGAERNMFVNAGVAAATGGESVSARAGVGFVWK